MQRYRKGMNCAYRKYEKVVHLLFSVKNGMLSNIFISFNCIESLKHFSAMTGANV